MTAITFDTLAYAKRLQQAGVSAEQAEVQAEALRDVVDEKLATKQDIALLQRDIKELESTLRRDIAEMKFDAVKWLIGLLAVQTGLIIAVFKLLA
jgi:hypothetical protein